MNDDSEVHPHPVKAQKKLIFPQKAVILLVLSFCSGIAAILASQLMPDKIRVYHDELPEKCCDAESYWKDLYCVRCLSPNGCTYQDICNQNPDWTKCCFDDACNSASNHDLFKVCDTGGEEHGFVDFSHSDIDPNIIKSILTFSFSFVSSVLFIVFIVYLVVKNRSS